jgi:DNA-binding SARP family transcriptional activator
MADVPRECVWCRERRDYLTSSFVIAAERMADYTYGQGHYQQCIDVCSWAIDADPTADEMVIWLLRAYAQVELYAELEQTYRSYLRVSRLDAQSDAGRQDAVVQLYQALGRARVR